MSYHASSFWHQPRPYTQSDKNAMVPGWGMSLEHAGPPMIAIGYSPDGLGATAKPKLAFTPAAKCPWAFAIEKLCSEGKITNASTCGQAASSAYDCRTQNAPANSTQTQPMPIVQPTDNTNMWIWITCGVIVLGAGGLFAYNKGWFGKKKAVAMTANARHARRDRYGRYMISHRTAKRRSDRRRSHRR